MSRCDKITVNEVTYEVGWNEEGWFAVDDRGNCTAYHKTLAELREAVSRGEWETDIGGVVLDAETYCRLVDAGTVERYLDDVEGRGFDFDPDSDDMRLVAELAGFGYCDLGGEGGGA